MAAADTSEKALRARGIELVRAGRFDEARAVFEAVVALHRTPGGADQLAGLAFASLELACHLHGVDEHADAVGAARAEAAGACDRLAAAGPDSPPPAAAVVDVYRRLVLLLRDLDGGPDDDAPDWTTALDIAWRVHGQVGADGRSPLPALAYTLADLVNRIVRPREYPYTGAWDDDEEDDYEVDDQEDPDEAVQRAVTDYERWFAGRSESMHESVPRLADLACALAERGHRLNRAGRSDEALAIFEAVVALWRLGPATPRWQAPLAFACLQVACHPHEMAEQAEAASAAGAEAAAICDRLVEAAPPGNPMATTIRWYLRIVLLLRDADDHNPDDEDAADWATTRWTAQDAYSRIGHTDTTVPRAALAYVLAQFTYLILHPDRTVTSQDIVERFEALLEPMSSNDVSLVRELVSDLLIAAPALAERGHPAEALRATQQAAALMRWQATADFTNHDWSADDNIDELVPSRTEHDDWRTVASVLEQLSARLDEAGSLAEAVAEQADAVTWYRKLIDWRRAVGDRRWSEESAEPPSLERLGHSLAGALNNLAWRLGRLGSWPDALPAIEEAVTIDARSPAGPDDPAQAEAQRIHRLTLIEVYEGLGRDTDAQRLRAEDERTG